MIGARGNLTPIGLKEKEGETTHLFGSMVYSSCVLLPRFVLAALLFT